MIGPDRMQAVRGKMRLVEQIQCSPVKGDGSPQTGRSGRGDDRGQVPSLRTLNRPVRRRPSCGQIVDSHDAPKF